MAWATIGPAGSLEGPLAARPSTAPPGTLYFATDDNGGTTYRRNAAGTAWAKLGAGVTEGRGVLLARSVLDSTVQVPASQTAAADVGCSVTFTPSDHPVWAMLTVGLTFNMSVLGSLVAPLWSLARVDLCDSSNAILERLCVEDLLWGKSKVLRLSAAYSPDTPPTPGTPITWKLRAYTDTAAGRTAARFDLFGRTSSMTTGIEVFTS